MLKVAHKLRTSAEQADDPQYVALFLRGAIALEDRAAQLAFYPSGLKMPDVSDEDDAALHRHVDFYC